jgi:hypothetical protein
MTPGYWINEVKKQIKYSSRCNCAQEMEEMRKVIVELEYKQLDSQVIELFYDSKACVCDVILNKDQCEWWLIKDILEHHINQFCLRGCIYHKRDNL